MKKITQRSTNPIQKYMATSDHLKTLYLFNAFSLVGGIIYGTYYGIFLYSNTFSLSILAIDGLLGGIGLWLGYVTGVICIKKLGYKGCIRTAFAGWMLVSFATAIIAENIADWFMVIAVLKAFPAGLFGASGDTMLLRDVKGSARDNFLQIQLTFELFTNVLLPSIVGALISFTGGYELAFGLAGVVYMFALFIPISIKRPQVSLSAKECLRIFQRPLYKQHAMSRMFSSSFNQLNALAATIIPFMLLADELKVGLLTSAAALAAGTISFMLRGIKGNRKVGFGYASHIARGMASLQFILLWSAPSLVVWRLVGKLAAPLQGPLQEGINIQNDDLILGKDLEEQALQINLLNKTLLLLGSTFGYGLFFLLTQQAAQQKPVLQTLIITFALWQAVNLTWTMRINKRANGVLLPPHWLSPQLLMQKLAWQYVRVKVQFSR